MSICRMTNVAIANIRQYTGIQKDFEVGSNIVDYQGEFAMFGLRDSIIVDMPQASTFTYVKHPQTLRNR